MSDSLFHQGEEHTDGFRDVDPSAVRRHGGAINVVDVREPHEFAGELGHVPGATLVPLSIVASAASEWDRHADILLVCRSGKRSSMAAHHLVRMGFTRVMNLRGGMIAYNAATPQVGRAAS
jgi:sulfur-carrier protein adenylyltransferase/sulfurtransferase